MVKLFGVLPHPVIPPRVKAFIDLIEEVNWLHILDLHDPVVFFSGLQLCVDYWVASDSGVGEFAWRSHIGKRGCIENRMITSTEFVIVSGEISRSNK